jgi:hypothetical protein
MPPKKTDQARKSDASVARPVPMDEDTPPGITTSSDSASASGPPPLAPAPAAGASQSTPAEKEKKEKDKESKDGPTIEACLLSPTAPIPFTQFADS